MRSSINNIPVDEKTIVLVLQIVNVSQDICLPNGLRYLRVGGRG